MRQILRRFLGEVRASFWFVPSLLSLTAIALASATLALDRRGTSDWLGDLTFVYLNQPEGARAVLSTIAGSMINVAGVVFSLTMVTLTLAAQQFGPRLIGNLMRDRGNQVVLGIFVATFIYCLLILRTVRGEGADLDAFVPHLSVAVALLITLLNLGALIYFIHHVASAIQVKSVVGTIESALARRLAPDQPPALFPSGMGEPAAVTAALPEGRARLVGSPGSGYIGAVAASDLMAVASEHDLVVALLARPGDFVLSGAPLLRVWPHDASEEVIAGLVSTVPMERARGGGVDLESLFDQLLELALRALSPSMNDPFTAMRCVDRIGDALLELGRRELPSPYRADESGELRVVTPEVDIAAFSGRMFSSLRSGVSTSLLAASHTVRLLDSMLTVTTNPVLAEALSAERASLMAAARAGLGPVDYDTLQALA